MRITIPTLVLSLLVLPLPVAAQTQTQTIQTFYIVDQAQLDPCTEELVNFTGQGHMVTHFTIDPTTTRKHVTDVQNTMGPLSGVGMFSSMKYRANETVITTANTSGQTDQFDLTMVLSEVIMSEGSTSNFVLHTTVHVTVNANGVPTADVLKMKADCTGQ